MRLSTILLINLLLLVGCSGAPPVAIKSDNVGSYKADEAVVYCSLATFSWPNFRDYVLTRFPDAQFGTVVKIESVEWVVVVRNLQCDDSEDIEFRNLHSDIFQFLRTVPSVIKVTPIYLKQSKDSK